MAVGAYDLALLDLGQDSVPGPLTHASANAESFFSQVIELQNERVALSTIDARMLTKKRDEIGGALGHDPFGAAAGRIDVALPIAGIVFVLVGGPAWAAIVVALTARFSAPGKFSRRFSLLAAPTDPHVGGNYRYEQTFP
jgi:hypothetical protein